jgi:hypothetical protein
MSLVSAECASAMTTGGKGRVFGVLRRRGPILPADPDLNDWIAKTFVDPSYPSVTDDRWLAEKLAASGSEPRWPLADFQERQRRATMVGRQWNAEPGGIEADLPVPGTSFSVLRAVYFPGTTPRRAMIISGVHGDELAGVEVVEMVLPSLKTVTRAFSIIVVPRVFAANCLAKRRKTSPDLTDPNRQMPKIGGPPGPPSAAGTTMEPENQVLLDLIQRFQPERLLSVHGITRESGLAGITSDPRPGYESADRSLALDMARAAAAAGGSVPGNRLGTSGATATYPTQTMYHEKGVTLGQYESAPAGSRPAINMILIETHGKPATGSPGAYSVRERDALVKAVLDVFLNP